MAPFLLLCMVVAAPSAGRTSATVGTLQYDNDVPFSRDTTGLVVGNRFNVGVVDPHSIASVSFRLAGAGTSAALIYIFDVNPTAMTLGFLGGGLLPGIPLATSGTMLWVFPLSTPVVGHTGSFLGVLHNSNNVTCATQTMLGALCDGVALTSGIVDPGLGFHAVRAFTPATSGVDIPGRNAIVRVTGDNLPVELMSLDIE
jgi:hypothetical protein